MRRVSYLKAGGVVLMALYGIACATSPAMTGSLDRVDLVIHEAGHLFFGWFGEFLGVLGGTLGQLFVPAAFTVYFYLRKERFSSAVTLFWVGQSLFNVSVYVRDAQAMALPLVSVGGGQDTIHDWHYLLTTVGLLRWDQEAGAFVYLLGLLTIVAAIAAAGYVSFEREASQEDG